MAKTAARKKKQQAGSPRPRPFFLITRIRTAMNDQLTKQFRKLKLTPALGEVLHTVRLEGHASSSMLARRLGITPQSIKQSIHTLEKLGFVRRSVAQHDNRILTVELTRSGEEAQRFCRSVLDEMYPEVFGNLSESEMTQLVALLAKVLRKTRPELMDLYFGCLPVADDGKR